MCALRKTLSGGGRCAGAPSPNPPGGGRTRKRRCENGEDRRFVCGYPAARSAPLNKFKREKISPAEARPRARGGRREEAAAALGHGGRGAARAGGDGGGGGARRGEALREARAVPRSRAGPRCPRGAVPAQPSSRGPFGGRRRSRPRPPPARCGLQAPRKGLCTKGGLFPFRRLLDPLAGDGVSSVRPPRAGTQSASAHTIASITGRF